MRWTHPRYPDRRVRLAYCMNLHPGESMPELRAGIDMPIVEVPFLFRGEFGLEAIETLSGHAVAQIAKLDESAA